MTSSNPQGQQGINKPSGLGEGSARVLREDGTVFNFADALASLVGDTGATGFSAFQTVFGDMITASRAAQSTGNFYLGISSDAAEVTATGSATLTITGNAGFENLLTAQTGTTIGSTITVEDADPIRYIPGYEFGAWFTPVFIIPTDLSGYNRVGFMDANNGFWLGFQEHEGSIQFGVAIRKDGADKFIPQSEFNIDTLDGNGPSSFTVDFTKGNIFRIRAGYLGFAPPTYEVVLPNGKIIPFHQELYPNTSEETHISSTYISPRAEVSNGNAAENVSVKIGSYCTYLVDGESLNVNDRPFTLSLDSIIVPAGARVQTEFIAFRNTGSFQGALSPTAKDHKIPAVLESLQIASDGQTSNMTFELFIVDETDLLNTPTWIKDDPDSILDYTIDSPDYDLSNAKRIASGILTGSGGIFGVQFDTFSTEAKDKKLRTKKHAVFTFTGGGTGQLDVNFNNSWREKF